MSAQYQTEIFSIEDNPAERRLLEIFLAQVDPRCHLTFAETGGEASKRLGELAGREPPCLPDLILLDLNLPDRDGHSLLCEIRNHPKLKDVPVIIFSNSRNPADMGKSQTYQANAYFTKPPSADEFEALLRRILTVELPSYRRFERESVA
jgi:CheY-like chemotaxis protein